MSSAITAAVVTGYMADRAADKSADATKKGIKSSLDITNRARQDAIALFDNSARRKGIGLDQALAFYKQNALKRMDPFVQGNQAAQNIIGQGARQANNAILGLPVDMGFTEQVQPNVDYSGINAAMTPQLGTGIAATVNAAQPAAPAPTQTLSTALGNRNVIFGQQGGLGGYNVRT